jgi:Flp pilus assembly protein TadD
VKGTGALAFGPRQRRLLLGPVLAAGAVLAGCASGGPLPTETLRQAWAREVEPLGLDPSVVSSPVAFTQEMRGLAREVAVTGEEREQLALLQDYLFDEEFPFTYQLRGTFTAVESFELRRGNCVSFTSLFIALARSLDIPVRAALIYRGDTERDGELVVVNTHMVAVYHHSTGMMVYDFAEARERPPSSLWLIDDFWVGAIHLNNRGTEEIRAGRNESAVGFLEAAIRLAPEFTAPYSNLGVALRLGGDVEGALGAYSKALKIKPGDPTTLQNLAALYRSLGRHGEADDALRAARLSGANPFLLIARGDLERSQGHVREARALYRRAQRHGSELPEPHLALARLELEQGRLRAARRAVERALALDPEHDEVRLLQRRLH